MQKLIRLPQVIERTTLSRSSIYEMMSNGTFPKPVKLSLRANGWIEAEIDAWLASRIEAREAA